MAWRICLPILQELQAQHVEEHLQIHVRIPQGAAEVAVGGTGCSAARDELGSANVSTHAARAGGSCMVEPSRPSFAAPADLNAQQCTIMCIKLEFCIQNAP